MRISDQEKQQIVAALSLRVQEILGVFKAELFLYGSRTDDSKRGGDIDLALVVSDPSHSDQLQTQKHLLLNAIKSKIGDQKIDFSIKSARDAQSDPFWKVALAEGILLHRWGA